jgi:hypothetical protein
MATRDKLRRLEKAIKGSLGAIEQADGTTFYYDPAEAFESTFLFFSNSLRADYYRQPRPEPPPLLRAVVDAKDRREALSRVMGSSSFLPIDREALVERGEFVPRSLVAGREYGDFEGLEDLSE